MRINKESRCPADHGLGGRDHRLEHRTGIRIVTGFVAVLLVPQVQVQGERQAPS